MKKQLPAIFLFILVLFLALLGQRPVICNEKHKYLHTPSDGAILKNNCPVITFSLEGFDPDMKTLRFCVNQDDVTPYVMKMTHLLSYTVIKPLPDGETKVYVSFDNKDGEKVGYEWYFTVKSSNPIKTVEHDATAVLDVSRSINVTMTGDPQCKATFDIGELYKGIPMNEVSPGVYKGIYRIEPGDNVTNADIRGNLIAPDGSRFFKKADTPVTIDTRFFKVTILEPADNGFVPQTFVLKGHTNPRVQVKITTSIAFSVTGDTTTASGKPSPAITLDADENGDFEQKLGFPASLRGMKMVIKVIAIDEKGQQSIPDTLTVNLKPGAKTETK